MHIGIYEVCFTIVSGSSLLEHAMLTPYHVISLSSHLLLCLGSEMFLQRLLLWTSGYSWRSYFGEVVETPAVRHGALRWVTKGLAFESYSLAQLPFSLISASRSAKMGRQLDHIFSLLQTLTSGLLPL